MGLLLARGGIWLQVGGADLHGLFVPRYEAAGRALKQLRVPLWNRDEFCGVPLLGGGQGAVLYPPVPLLFASLDSWIALQAFYALHIFVLAWAMRRYLAYHGLGLAASAIAAVVMTTGVLGPRQAPLDHPTFLAAVTWAPLALLAYARAARETLRPWFALLALALGLQWLAGYPEYSIDTALLVGLTALLDAGTPLGRRLGVAVGGLALGAALGAVLILPLAEAVGESTREVYHLGGGPWLSLSLAWRALSEHTLPVFLLAALGLAAPIRGRLGWAVCLTWCLFAVYRPFALLYWIPPYSRVRLPLAWRSLSFVFTGCLAGAGVEFLVRRRGIVATALTASLALWLVALAGVRLFRAPDLFRPLDGDRKLSDERMSRLKTLQAATGMPRVVSVPDIRIGAMLRHDVLSAAGYEPSVPPRRMVQLLDAIGIYPYGQQVAAARLAAHPDLAALLGIGLVVVPPPASRLEQAGFRSLGPVPGGDIVLYRPPIPRARLVHRAVRVAGESASAAYVIEHAADASTTAVVDADASFALAEPAGGVRERATIVVDEPERVEVEAIVGGPALLVVTDSFYPGWVATVDGVPVPILRADHAFRAVALAPGTRRVRFLYAPASVRWGAAASGSAALVVLALCVWRGRQEAPRDGSISPQAGV